MVFKNLKKIRQIEQDFQKYRIRKTVEKGNTLETTLTLEPLSRYKIRVYSENSCGRATSINDITTIYVQGEFSLWVNGEKYDTFTFNRSIENNEAGPQTLQGFKVYEFNPKEETEIKIEGKKQRGKILCVEVFKDVPQHLDLEAKETAEVIGASMEKFAKRMKLLLPAMLLILLVVVIITLVAVLL